MEIKDTYNFLLRSAIPEILEKKKLPDDLRWKRGHKEEKVNEEGYSSKKLVWECISRAHRDVLSGRKNVEDYFSQNTNGINDIALELYEKITGNQKIEQLSSEELIKYLVKERGYRIGSVQKLVNMTLKYMYILQLFGKLEKYHVNENDCDCPLDSRIMDIIEMGNFKWTKDFENNDDNDGYQKYNDIQKIIENKQGEKSKLSYDFENWQKI